MPEAVDYFSNHAMKFRFPWRLYHQPILETLQRAISGAPGNKVLNVGSGPFFEREKLETTGIEFTLCDVDERAIAVARELHGAAIAHFDVTGIDQPLPYADGTFDLVISMDVIEHLPDPEPWLRQNIRVLKPGGHLFLTTPNYGSPSLVMLENTALEAIARAQGFSRKKLHPTKFNRTSLEALLRQEKLERVLIQPIAFDWVLSAFAMKPRNS